MKMDSQEPETVSLSKVFALQFWILFSFTSPGFRRLVSIEERNRCIRPLMTFLTTGMIFVLGVLYICATCGICISEVHAHILT